MMTDFQYSIASIAINRKLLRALLSVLSRFWTVYSRWFADEAKGHVRMAPSSHSIRKNVCVKKVRYR